MVTKEKEHIHKSRALKAVIFVIAAALLFFYLNQVFGFSETDSNKRIFGAFYAQEENTVDVVYIGSSATNRYFIAPKAYNDEGMAAFDLAVMGFPLLFVPNVIDEVEKTQDPELYIIELRGILKSREDVTDAHIRRVTDSMKISANKYDAIDKALEYVDGADSESGNIDEALDYYIPVIKYHSRLVQGDMTAADLLPSGIPNFFKGFVVSPKTFKQVPQKEPVYSDGYGELAPEMEKVLNDMLDKCDETDKEVLFVLAPYSMKEGEAEKFNTAVRMVTERGYTVLNMNTEEMVDEIGLDWETDFYNSKHVNFIGAEKYTEFLTEYLAENYDLPDRRGDKAYESWDEAYERYLMYLEKGPQDSN